MDFERVAPETLGIRSQDISEFLQKEYEAGVELHSFMLIRHGKVAAEGWYAPYSKDERHIIYSFSKTFTAAAIGFAQQEGILSLDEKLVDLFPEDLPDSVSENLALADIESLLTMSCGHETEICTKDIQEHEGNWVKAFFAQEFKYRPHTMFQYNTFGTDLLCVILQKKTGMSLTEYLTPRLFDVIGIHDVYCSKMGDRIVEPGAAYSEVEGGGWGYHVRTEDLARFIWFLEQRGVWNGQRLLPEEWFDRAFSKRIETLNKVYAPQKSNWQQGYCYQCWCNSFPMAGSWRADGAYGQFGYVLPGSDAIMIMTSAAVDTESQLNIFAETIAGRMSDAPLKENPEDLKALQCTLQNLRLRGQWSIRQPWSESLISGKTFFIDNPEGYSLEEFIGGEGHFGHDSMTLQSMCFSFVDNQLEISFDEQRINRDKKRLNRDMQRNNPDKHGINQDKQGINQIEQRIHRDDSDYVRQALFVGLDGTYKESVLADGTYYASGRWTAADAIEIEVRFSEALGAAMIQISFKESDLELKVRSQIPEDNSLTERYLYVLRGRTLR